MSKVEIMVRGRFLQFVRRRGWEFVQRRGVSGVVCISAVTADDELLLVEQYREPLGARVIELPAGLAGDIAGLEQEDLESAARRELLEETGYRVEGPLERVFCGPTSAGLTDETVLFFNARGAVREHAGGGTGAEAITVHVVPRRTADDWLFARIAGGRLIDPKVFTGLHLLREASGGSAFMTTM